MTHTQYTEFFRDIARRHKEIRHSETEARFARLILSVDPFLSTHHQLGEFLEGVRNTLHTPMMLLTSYQVQYADNRSDSLEKMLAGRLIILDSVSPKNDYQREEQVLTDTERMAEECLGFADQYFTNFPEAGFFEWNGAGSEKIAKLTSRNLFGTAVDFAIKVYNFEHLAFNSEQFDTDGSWLTKS